MFKCIWFQPIFTLKLKVQIVYTIYYHYHQNTLIEFQLNSHFKRFHPLYFQ